MMRVTKRNGESETVSFDKVTNRLRILCNLKPKLTEVNFVEIAQKVISRIYDGVHTYELDELAAQQCTQKGVDHIEYNALASRIAISNNQKSTSPSFSETIYMLYNNIDVSFIGAAGLHTHIYPSVIGFVEMRGGIGLLDINAEEWQLPGPNGKYNWSRNLFFGLNVGIIFRIF